MALIEVLDKETDSTIRKRLILWDKVWVCQHVVMVMQPAARRERAKLSLARKAASVYGLSAQVRTANPNSAVILKARVGGQERWMWMAVMCGGWPVT